MSPVKAHKGCRGPVRELPSDGSFYCDGCQWPVKAADVVTVSDNGRRPGQAAPRPAPRRTGDLDGIPEAIPEDPEASAEVIPLRVRSLDDLLAEPDEPLDVVIADGGEGAILTADGKGVIDAATGVGKTNLLIYASRCLCEGVPWLGFPIPAPRIVLYLALEGSRRNLKRRLRKAFAGASDEARARFHFARISLDLSDAGALEGLRQQLEELRPDVVILDTLREAHPWDENLSHEAKRLTTILDSLQQRYLFAWLLAHHDRKRPPFVRIDDGTDRLRGSTGLAGWLTFSLALDPDRSDKTPDRLLASWGKNRDAEEPLHTLALDFDREHLAFIVSDRAADGEVAELTVQAAILSVAGPEGWAYGPDLIAGLIKAGSGETRIRQRIRDMVAAKRLQERKDSGPGARPGKSYSLADQPPELPLELDA